MKTHTNWPVVGPQVLKWLRAELPRRTTIKNIYHDCRKAVPAVRSADSLRLYLTRQASAEWLPIKRTLGTGTSVSRAAAPKGGMSHGTLDEFVREKRKRGCKVCALPAEVLEILRTASEKKHKVEDQVSWLNDWRGYPITRAELESHRNGRHEQ